MLFVFLGVLLGLLVALGPIPWLHVPFDLVNEALVSATGDTFLMVVDHLPFDTSGLPVRAIAALLSTVAPGIAALTLVTAARAKVTTRRTLSLVMTTFALVSFFFLPAGTSVVLLLLAITVALAARVPGGILLTVPLIMLATILAARHGVLLWTGDSEEIASAARILGHASGTELTAGMDGVWKVTLTILGLAPFVMAFQAMVRGNGKN